MRSDRFSQKPANRYNRKPACAAVASARHENLGRVAPILLSDIHYEKPGESWLHEAAVAGFDTDLDVLTWLCALAAESPTSRGLLRHAQGLGCAVKLADLEHHGFDTQDTDGCIVLNHYGFAASALSRSPHFRNVVFINFVQALRQIWHGRHARGLAHGYRADGLLMLERAKAADLETVAILVGWELRGAGYPDVWRGLLGSDQGDMAMIFTRAIENDPSGFYDGSVLTRTFCQWYGDEGRVALSDHHVLERLDRSLREAARGEAGSFALSGQAVEALATLPGGRSYLLGMGGNIASDPYFVSLNDPINEAHLFQIVYDSRAIVAGGVPFRDGKLAQLIFPADQVTVRD